MREILQGYDALLKTIDQMGGLLAREPKMHRLVGQASIDAGRMLALTLDAAGIPRDEWNEFAQKHTTGRL